MGAHRLKIWQRVHEWTSLVSTAFLFLLCLTGLPLIFHHEIDAALGNTPSPPVLAAGTPALALDEAVAKAMRTGAPGEFLRYIVWDKDEPDLLSLIIAPNADPKPEENRALLADARTGEPLGPPLGGDTFIAIMFRLHVDMFAGLPGKLFLGAMGLVFLAALVSGVVLYAPFAHRQAFATVRPARSRRLRWLDWHNLIGVVTLLWALVVGGTGTINTLADLVLAYWQNDQLAEMVAPYAGQPPATHLSSVGAAVAAAREAAPGMTPSFVAYPGTEFTSKHHFGIFMHGETPLTARLLKPVLIDAETGALTASRDLPWYVTALLVSQPLHFGDYGGLPLQIVWALLDIATLVVLGSGLYLWLSRKVRRPTAKHAVDAATAPGHP